MIWILLYALIFQFQMIVSNVRFEEASKCDIRYCEKGKTCTYSNTSSPVDCKCMQGYSGENCTDTDECIVGEKDPCVHRGVCLNTVGSYTCNCLSSWSGDHCQKKIQNTTECLPGYSGNRCELALCDHGYAVNSTNAGNFTCYCDSGWSHVHNDDPCDIDINECEQYPSICQNGGNCSNTNGSYICDCEYLWDGENCTYKNFCLADPCENFGNCYKTGGDNDLTYDCKCIFGFKGKNCTKDIDECSLNTTSVCSNGNCTNTYGSYNCTCDTGWAGKNCNVTLNTTTTTEKTSTVTLDKSTSAIIQETMTTNLASSTQESDDIKSSSMQPKDGTPIIIGAASGGVVVVIVVCIVGYYLYKRKSGRVGTVDIAGDTDKNEKFNIERISKTDEDLDSTDTNTGTH